MNNPYVYKLSVVHRRLDEEVRAELKRRLPDDLRVARLKKLRLAVKDRIAAAASRRPGASPRATAQTSAV